MAAPRYSGLVIRPAVLVSALKLCGEIPNFKEEMIAKEVFSEHFPGHQVPLSRLKSLSPTRPRYHHISDEAAIKLVESLNTRLDQLPAELVRARLGTGRLTVEQLAESAKIAHRNEVYDRFDKAINAVSEFWGSSTEVMEMISESIPVLIRDYQQLEQALSSSSDTRMLSLVSHASVVLPSAMWYQRAPTESLYRYLMTSGRRVAEFLHERGDRRGTLDLAFLNHNWHAPSTFDRWNIVQHPWVDDTAAVKSDMPYLRAAAAFFEQLVDRVDGDEARSAMTHSLRQRLFVARNHIQISRQDPASLRLASAELDRYHEEVVAAGLPPEPFYFFIRGYHSEVVDQPDCAVSWYSQADSLSAANTQEAAELDALRIRAELVRGRNDFDEVPGVGVRRRTSHILNWDGIMAHGSVFDDTAKPDASSDRRRRVR